jgi:hypothetical protein
MSLESQPEQPLSEREAMLLKLEQQVRDFSPEQFKTVEKREQIADAMINGLDMMAQINAQKADEEGISVQDLPLKEIYTIYLPELAHTVLTNPLPGQPWEYEDGEAPLEAEIASGHDWWEVLSPEQRQAVSEVVRDAVGLDVMQAPANEDPIEPRIFQRAQTPLTLQDGSEIIPMIIVTNHGPGLTAIPKEETE